MPRTFGSPAAASCPLMLLLLLLLQLLLTRWTWPGGLTFSIPVCYICISAALRQYLAVYGFGEGCSMHTHCVDRIYALSSGTKPTQDALHSVIWAVCSKGAVMVIHAVSTFKWMFDKAYVPIQHAESCMSSFSTGYCVSPFGHQPQRDEDAYTTCTACKPTNSLALMAFPSSKFEKGPTTQQHATAISLPLAVSRL